MSVPFKQNKDSVLEFENLFLKELNSSKVVKLSCEKIATANTNSIGSIKQTALDSIQSLFDKKYSEGGYKEAMSFGKEFSSGLLDKDVNEILDSSFEKQVTGVIAEKVMEATGALEYLKNNVNIPKDDGSNDKGAVLSLWKEAWNSLSNNASLMANLFGGIVSDIISIFQNKPWYLAIGLAIWKLGKIFDKQLSKVFKFLKLIPGLSIFLDIALAIKNICYVIKELTNSDWNQTMSEIGQEGLMVKSFDFKPSINYPNSIVRTIGESIEGLTEKMADAFSMGVIATKCTGAGFVSSKMFNKILEDKEAQFLSGQIDSNTFARQVAFHIKASRKIKVVCSEMIGLICNTSSAIFDLATATGVGVIITILGNLIIAGIDMAVREAIIKSAKAFEDFWSKKLLDYQKIMITYFNFANDSHKRLSADKKLSTFDKNKELNNIKLVDKKEMSEKNQMEADKAKEEVENKKTASGLDWLLKNGLHSYA